MAGLALTMILLTASTSRAQEPPEKPMGEADVREALLATAVPTDKDNQISVTEPGGGTVILIPKGMTIKAAEQGSDEDPDDIREARLKAARETPDYTVADDNFDLWVFGAVAGAKARLAWLDVDLRVMLARAAADHALSESEAAKLAMAGRGDIKRFFDSVEARRRQFEAARSDYLKGIAVLTEVRPLSKDFSQGLFGPTSLFAKTLAKILADRPAPPR